MKPHYASELKTNEEVLDFYMAKTASIRVGSNGKQYFDITLGDRTGEVSGKKWDVQPTDVSKLEQIREGDIVRVKGTVTEWQGAKQIRIMRIRKAVPSDAIDIAEYVKAAPENSAEMYEYIYAVADEMNDPDLRKLCTRVLSDNRERLLYYPAASRNHHAMYGGLLYHTKCMLMNGLGVCRVYPYLNRDLLAAGVILHDIMKMEEILSNEYGVSPGYSMEGQFLGHLVMGVKYVDRLTEEMQFPREKALMLEQMILSHHYEPEFGSPVRPLFPEGEVLHYLDILDARLMDMQNALATVEPGHFSERIWTLDNRRVYQRTSPALDGTGRPEEKEEDEE
ncbi:3'-5' exoribonuclease YhaM family protein [Eubacterium pyruvativorans]|uniref:3'-5' exoribonuclease YhaM family protein n=1 Tax=Eubacterium pyruvativorans TaxID=155865 RepID=UPI0008901FAA|nr:OB-fold nucleic acid binding domain-containing protein [Eubacterium pyruvativorans]MCI5747562.1 OB-fold nucleic acid binding domain-containing protein [Eubacterium pyruvativorans]MDD7684090.1 OB-fold nucleic acid binding domain-containing protein [Eubacterium pyruvativorans]MDY4049138.1 OB-fold nucleic acid binding domain-containing protein [Eubacterium pyruvativorans]SDF56546.1 3'-5' exoribonuclease [Eubacterium pyruvativorans]